MTMSREITRKALAWGLAFVFCAISTLALAWPVSASAAQNETAQDETKTVRVGYYENEVFEEGAQEGAVKTGYAYEYYRKISEYTGWEYEYVYGSFGDLYQMLLDGEVDLLAGLAWKEDRANLIGYPDAAMGNESYSLVKHATDESVTTDPSTLNGKKIGVLDSAIADVLDNYLDAHSIEAEVVKFADYDDLFAAFDSGDLDILAAEGDGAYGRKQAEVLLPFGASDYFLCTAIARPDLLEELNEAQELMAIEEPNYISSLRTKYYPNSISARAFSAGEKEWIDTHDSLHIGYLENYLPYSDTDADGRVTGLVKDIVPQILDSLGLTGIEVSYSGYRNYDDMVADVGSGAIDAAFPVGGGLYYSEESGIYQSSAVVSALTELVFKGEFTDETTATIAVNENNRMQYYYVKEHYPNAQILLYPSIEDCLRAVMSGEAGCTTLNGLRANDILKNGEYRGLSLRQTSSNDDRCFGVDIGNMGLLKLLNRGINVIGSDYSQNLAYRYTAGLYSYTLLDVIQDNAGIFAAIIAAIVALVIAFLVREARRKSKEVARKESARQELEAANRELAESEQALALALVEAEQASRAKTTFLNNMSHDIRTPMNAIVGFTTLAESHLDDQELVRSYLGKIAVSSQHLLALINDVLDMSRIESGKMTLEETGVNLVGIIQDLRTIVQPDADKKHLDLTVDTQGVVHEDVVTDKLRLNQVLLNILSNAIKFTPEGGAISFQVLEKPATEADVAEFEFRIKDNGIGMSEEFQKTIFDAFTRERSTTVSGIQGTGLGMAITKSIVDMMGGTISVSSKEGEGSEFVVDLPCKISEKSVETARSTTKRDFTGKRALLVEDNEMNQTIAEMILRESGFDVAIAADGVEAVEMVEASPAAYYDVVLMDVQMPRMDGYEATSRIRALEDPGKASVPIVAVTANAFEEDANKALSVGMNGHLAKPYDISAIMETLDSLIP